MYVRNIADRRIFNKSIKTCSKVLKESSLTTELKYLSNKVQLLENDKGRKQKREIIQFNPPYSKKLLGKVFLKLLKKNVPAKHQPHGMFNKNTVKITYSCMKNINSVPSFQNKNILNPRTTSFRCNCRHKESCILNRECLTWRFVCRATVTNSFNEDMKKYIDLADTISKERHSNHKKYFKHEKNCNCRELVKYMLVLKENNIILIIK